MDPDSSTRGRTIVASIALVVLVAAVFGRAIAHRFVGIDTSTYLMDNAPVSAGLTGSGFVWAFTTFHAANWHPLTWLSHMLDVELFGFRPAGHHAMNVVLHAANSVLVFLVLRAWTARFGPSFVVAALFAVHPLHAESVAWIVERKDVLSSFFGLAALLAWTGWARGRSRKAWCAALLLFAAALMSKPMLVTLPFVMLVADVWPLQRTSLGWKRLVVEKLPFFALTIASCVLTWIAQSRGGAMQDLAALPIGVRAGNAVASWAWYALKTVWPSGLAFYYPLHVRGNAPAIVAGLIVIATVSGIAIAQRRRRPWIAGGWLIFLGMLVPVIGLVQVGGQARADRYAYLPLLGLLVAIVWTIDELVALAAPKRLLAAAFVILYAILCVQQVGTWKDDETLARRALAVNEKNSVAHDILGWTLFERGEQRKGLEHLQRALEIEPGDPDARLNFGRALLRLGQLDLAEEQLRIAAGQRPTDPRTLSALGSALTQHGSMSEGLKLMASAARAAPGSAEIRRDYGEALLRAGSLVLAERELRAALALAPGDLPANVDLARLLIETSRVAEAEPFLRAALRVEPRSPQALQQLARVLFDRGETGPAIDALRKALEGRPDWTTAQADLAWILATSSDEKLRNPREALGLAVRAVLSGNQENPVFLDVLAAAQAATGDFEGAVKSAGDAAHFAQHAGNPALADRIQKRIAAYQQGRMDTTVPR